MITRMSKNKKGKQPGADADQRSGPPPAADKKKTGQARKITSSSNTSWAETVRNSREERL